MKNNKGFTLIELMVVVGIIGIIAMIAIPNFRRFQAKAKQANAKTELATIYGMERAFHTEFSTYHDNLYLIGYTPDGYPNAAGTTCPQVTGASVAGPLRYYTTGFQAGGVPGTLIGITNLCTDTLFYFSSGAIPQASLPTTVLTQNAFTVGSAGAIGGPQNDHWTINEGKLLTNTQVGF